MEKSSVTPSPLLLTDLPIDELAAYGRGLGLSVDPTASRGEILRLIRDRQELLVELDREVLLDVVVWARVPVRRSASKEQLARHIAAINRTRFEGLSEPGLLAFARLRGMKVRGDELRTALERRLRSQGGLWARVQRKRREVVGSLISRVLEQPEAEGDYRFLPEEHAGTSLRASIEDAGVMGGIAQKLRGAADHYLHEKLDEIERRIDRKLDEIDRRLGEWRDQEIKNRLRIIKITLVTAIVVAIISLGYDHLKSRNEQMGQSQTPTTGPQGTDRSE